MFLHWLLKLLCDHIMDLCMTFTMPSYTYCKGSGVILQTHAQELILYYLFIIDIMYIIYYINVENIIFINYYKLLFIYYYPSLFISV